MSKISYSAVVLDEKSRELLIDKFKSLVPDDWNIICHHMTINLGELDTNMKEYSGKEVKLVVNSFGFNNLVMAFGVVGFYSKNKKPHITFAVNRKDGGKPYMSNNIDNWSSIDEIIVNGKVEEVPYLN